MAIQTKTIDVIVKELLLELDLTNHFYAKMLYYCLDEYNRQARIMGINAKEVEVSFSSNSTASTGTYSGVTFTADNLGTVEGDITLTFDGVDDIDTVVNAWNTSNPNNTVTHDGTGTDVLAASTVTVTGGTNANRVAIPDDCQYVAGLYIGYGERKRTMVRDSTISIKYNTDGNNTIAYPDAEYALNTAYVNTDDDGRYFDYDLTNYGGMYGVAQEDDKNYNIDPINSEIIISNNCSTSDRYTLVYVPVAVSDSVANVVEYLYADTIKEYAKLQRLKQNRAYSHEVQLQQRRYNAVKKVMRAQRWPITKALAIKSVQKGMHAGPK